MKLERWCAVSGQSHGLESPEAEAVRLVGFVEGHPRYADGREVTTSTVVRPSDKGVITVSGSEYELGSSSPVCESLYPGARERLLASLEQRGRTSIWARCGEI